MSKQISELPKELIQAIGGRLTYRDYTCFRAVCVFWRSALPERPPRQFPWLMFLHDKDKDNSSFFSLFDNKIHKLEVSNICVKNIYGSSEGWLIMGERHLDLFLLNPLTGDEIPTTLWNTYAWHKVVLSTSPAMTNDYLAMAINGSPYGLAGFSSRDKKWIPVIIPDENDTSYHDIIFFKDQFFAVDHNQRLIVCDVYPSSSLHEESTTIGTTIVSLPHWAGVCSTGGLYLVQMKDELLLVCKHRFFYVFKLIQSEWKWVKMKSLGDYILFLGYKSSFSVPAHEYPELKANCIYFSDAYWCNGDGQNDTASVGVFNLKDNSVELLPGYPYHTTVWPPPTWFLPSSSS